MKLLADCNIYYIGRKTTNVYTSMNAYGYNSKLRSCHDWLPRPSSCISLRMITGCDEELNLWTEPLTIDMNFGRSARGREWNPPLQPLEMQISWRILKLISMPNMINAEECCLSKNERKFKHFSILLRDEIDLMRSRNWESCLIFAFVLVSYTCIRAPVNTPFLLKSSWFQL